MSNNTDFEKALLELENIVNLLEKGDTTLDESIKLFEKGMELTSTCRHTLENAKQRIISLTEAEKTNAQ